MSKPRPSSSQRKIDHQIPVNTRGFPSSPHPARKRSSSASADSFPSSSDSLRLCASKGVWAKYSAQQRWSLTVSEGKTGTQPINKHRWQLRSSALIVSLLMRELFCCFPTITFTANINPCVARILAYYIWCAWSLRHHRLLHSPIIVYLYTAGIREDQLNPIHIKWVGYWTMSVKIGDCVSISTPTVQTGHTTALDKLVSNILWWCTI